MVERIHGKDEVPGSSPGLGSKWKCILLFAIYIFTVDAHSQDCFFKFIPKIASYFAIFSLA